MSVPSLPRDWVTTPFLRLLFQNLIVEEREDIRDASRSAWRTALSVIAASPGLMETIITPQLIFDWYAIAMTPLGVAIDLSTFYDPTHAIDGPTERHNVDKNMVSQDLSLITVEVTLKARVATATALAWVIAFWPVSAPLISLITITCILTWSLA
jgi:TATA-binding protein-associated factor